MRSGRTELSKVDAGRWQRIQELFEEASALGGAERIRFLREKTGDDAELLGAVMELLERDVHDDTLLDGGVARLAADLLDGSVPLLRRVGPYRVLDVLGQGGMGVVYLAERDDLGQRVAIKVLRDAHLSPARRERFEREQQTLAQLNHPGIARLYDADVLPDGTPYFVMECVQGEPLLAWCERHDCRVAERLRLFREVCEAVQYAHRRAVIHRDIKSSNILVARDDMSGVGSVRLLDFGIAKQIESVDTSAAQTRTGLRMMTPANAAPEQLRGEPVGVYTDVYALGLILYELLAGGPAFELTGLSPAQVEARFLDAAVRRPSERIREPDGSAAPDAVVLGTAAWNDLDVLCLTAMHADALRRYPTVEALLRDLDHYVNGEPLEARADTLRYRAGKFLARNRRPVAVAVVAVLGIAAGAVFHTARISAQRDRAELAAARAEEVSGYLIGLFEAGDPFSPGADSLDVRMLLDRGIERVEGLEGQPDLQAEMLDVLGRVHTQLAEYDRARELLQRALELRAGGEPIGRAATLAHLGRLHSFTGERDSAESALREALRIRERHLPSAHPTLAVNLNDLGSLLTEKAQYDEAEVLYRLALQIQRQHYGGPHRDLGETLSNLGVNFFNRGDAAGAEPWYRDALAVDRAYFGNEHPNVATRLANLAGVIEARGDFATADSLLSEALRILHERLGDDHYLTAYYRIQLGSMLRRAGRPERAEPVLREALATHERRLGRDHPNTIVALNQLALSLSEMGRYDDAVPQLRRAAASFRSALGEQHYYSGSTLCQLAHALHMSGRGAEAEPLFRQGLPVLETVLPPGHSSLVLTQTRFGALLVTLHRYEEAEPLLLESHRVLQEQRGPDHAQTREAASALVQLYDALGRSEDARQYRQALAVSAESS